MPQPPKTVPPPQTPSFFAGFLSYLVPGLGQIYQGRVGKGLLFLVCLYGMFFYGMYLGSWSNVYLPDVAEQAGSRLPRPVANVWYRLPFAGQFWIGIAAWPALWHYNTYDPVREPEPAPKDVETNWKAWVLHNLGTFQRAPYENRAVGGHRRLNEAPSDWPDKTLNELQIEGDKTWDLGWVFTVIAGVLNILVIYDAYAGPAFGQGESTKTPALEEAVA
jgi:TM2 domain-containing membrane protein YozV